MATRLGAQYPTVSYALSDEKTESDGNDAVNLYNETGRTAQEWQENLLHHMLAVDHDGLWLHTKIGYSVPRRNGKNEVLTMRELYGLTHGEHILHTAHRTTTSHSAAMRLAKLLDDSGYEEVIRVKKNEAYSKHYVFSKQFGLEKIQLLDGMGGVCDFRTRTSHGGLGEGFSTLIIDEAQEYTDEQESTLKYVVSDAQNPQTIMCGTPPTAVSIGTVFVKYREKTLNGGTPNGFWAEWSVDKMTDPNDVGAWYAANPSLGTILTERKIRDEIGNDDVDFNIQRLGLWLSQNQKSAISADDWSECKVDTLPNIEHELHVGIKYGQDGANVAMAIAARCDDGRIFVECIDCREVRHGTEWVVSFLTGSRAVRSITIDGASGQQMLIKQLPKNKKAHLPTVKEIITANASFEDAIFQRRICHKGQPSLTQVATNCAKRNIGSQGGFGYKSMLADVDISLLDACILAFYGADNVKEKTTQRVRV